MTVTAGCRAIQLGASALTVTANDSGTVSGQAACDRGLAAGVTRTARTPTLVRVSASGGYRALRRGDAVLQATASDGQQTATVGVRVNGPSADGAGAGGRGAGGGADGGAGGDADGRPGGDGDRGLAVPCAGGGDGVGERRGDGGEPGGDVGHGARGVGHVGRWGPVEVRVRALAVAAVQIVGVDSLAPTVRGTLRAQVTGRRGWTRR